jgi:hypothetical protein
MHTFHVTVANGGAHESVTYTWNVSGAAPKATLTTVPSSYTDATSATFAWSVAGSATSTVCSLDGAAATPCSSPQSFSGLARTSHTFKVTTSNAYGANSTLFRWTIY